MYLVCSHSSSVEDMIISFHLIPSTSPLSCGVCHMMFMKKHEVQSVVWGTMADVVNDIKDTVSGHCYSKIPKYPILFMTNIIIHYIYSYV